MVFCHGVLFCVLVEHNEVVKHPHGRPRRDGIHFLVHRHARRGVTGMHAQNAALVLRKSSASRGHSRQ
jgi:hypothetical protein